jgi:hypothetical protein
MDDTISQIDVMNDDIVKSKHTIDTFMPKTKTARNKMDKYKLYLICSMFNIHSPKYTKKSMLECIHVNLIK